METSRMAFYDRTAGKKTVSLTINSDLNRRLKAAGINASQVAEEALAMRLEQVEREVLAKAARADIESYNAYIAEHGLFADMLRDQEQGDPRDAEPV
jgi:antitoxin CcdA